MWLTRGMALGAEVAVEVVMAMVAAVHIKKTGIMPTGKAMEAGRRGSTECVFRWGRKGLGT